nr:efflux RND transporter periplasmic adaptor subunit [Candidatus Omnitrophota bacterium]
MIKGRYIFVILFIMIIFGAAFALTSCTATKKDEQGAAGGERQIQYYTCGMHPSVKVSPKEYNKGNKNCPICSMNLTPVYKEESQSQVSIAASDEYYGCGVYTEGKCPHCDLGKSDKDCICGGHSFMIKGQKINCPICGKPLQKIKKEDVKISEKKEKKILLYRNPMNPSITSKVPAKDPMGMDYIPVYEEDEVSAGREEGVVGRVKINKTQAQLAGVATETVRKLSLSKEIRTVGKVAYDPDMAIAQDEFISAVKAYDKIHEGNIEEINERALNLVNSSKRKLRLLGLGEEQIIALEEKKEVQTNLILPEDKMWIYGDVYEYELGWVKPGAKVKVMAQSLPGEEFDGVISSVNPVLDPKTRSLRFRASVDNPGLELKPEMYVEIIIISMYKTKDGKDSVLAVPKEAVLDTGLRKIVWVDKGDEEYQARLVETGPEAVATIDGKKIRFYPVLKGLAEGEEIVTKANFLIDSQSQISGVMSSAYGGSLEAEEKK